MLKPWEAFIYRASPEGIHHHTVDINDEAVFDVDAWGNEWESAPDIEWIRQS